MTCNLMAVVALAAATLSGPSGAPPEQKLSGVCYGPFRDGESPLANMHPLPSAMEKDIAFLAPWTRALRTYSVTNSLFLIPEIWEKYPDKSIILSEFGWPSAGKASKAAVPSPENQARYFREVIAMLQEEKIPYFWFAAFDEKWKTNEPNGAGPHWGLFKPDGSAKTPVSTLLPSAARKTIRRPPRSMRLKQ